MCALGAGEFGEVNFVSSVEMSAHAVGCGFAQTTVKIPSANNCRDMEY